MTLPLTHEQELISERNNYLAWKHFYPEGKGRPKKGHVLHHIDTTMRSSNLERYIQWNVEDLTIMLKADHTQLHMNLMYANGITPLTNKTNEELKDLAKKKRSTWYSHSDEWIEEQRAKTSKRVSGKNNPMYGIPCTYKMDEETIKQWKKNVGESIKGKIWWNNGTICKRSKECPGPEWKQGRIYNLTDESKKHLSDVRKGNHWFNDGTQEKWLKESPGPEWVRGRLKQ